jgi:hypothetical protein
MRDQCVNCKELEFTALSESNKQTTSTLASKLKRIWCGLIESLVAVNEFKIYSHQNKSGSTRWTIRDQISGHKVFFDSEQEVRTWLEKRYYR